MHTNTKLYNEDGKPLGDEPDIETLEEWNSEGYCETPDGCIVEPDGQCEHGFSSWLIIMGLI